MSTYLLAWNPKKYLWDDMEEDAETVDRESYLYGRWACAATHRIVEGDRIFLMRLGDEHRGIVASGWVMAHAGETVLPQSDVYVDNHWNLQAESSITWYVDIRFDALLGRKLTLPLSRLKRLNEDLPQSVESQWWTPQKSGIGIGIEVASKLEDEWQRFLASGTSTDEPRESSHVRNGLQARVRDRRRVPSIRARRSLVSRFNGQTEE